MKIDNRLFIYAGSSVDPDGSAKARFANDPEARPKVLMKAGHTNFVLVKLPKPMTKADAIKWLQETKPAGVDQVALAEKAAYINAQAAKIDAVSKGITKRRGRPANATKTEKVALMVKAQKEAKASVGAKKTGGGGFEGKTIKTTRSPRESAADSIVNTIVTTARAGKSIRSKVAHDASQISARSAASVNETV